MAFPRGRLSWVGFTSPRDLDQGTTLLVNTTLKFVETARLGGKLTVKGMNALQGPCLAFKSDAFVAASAELHFANCHNIKQRLGPQQQLPDEEDDDDEEEEEQKDSGDLMQISGGAMNVHGSLMVTGTLIIRDCSTKDGNGGSLDSSYGSLSPGIDDGGPQEVDLWVCYIEL